MAYEHLRHEQRGPVTLITIDRPERMITPSGPGRTLELVEAWSRFRDDDEALVGVLTGAGDRAFSAGGDLKEPTIPPDAGRAGARRGPAPRLPGTDALDRPPQADDRGGQRGGLRGRPEWVCWTDLAVADAHATFGVTCRRWNIGLAAGTQRLPRIVGYRRAMELIVTGRVIGAEEAREIGLVNEVVPTGTCVERASSWPSASPRFQPAIRTDHEAVLRGWGARSTRAAHRGRVLRPPARHPRSWRAAGVDERTHPDRRPDGPIARPWPGAAAQQRRCSSRWAGRSACSTATASPAAALGRHPDAPPWPPDGPPRPPRGGRVRCPTP